MNRLSTTLLAASLAISSGIVRADDLSEGVATKVSSLSSDDKKVRKNKIGNVVEVTPEDNKKMIDMLNRFFSQIKDRPYTQEHFFLKRETNILKKITVSTEGGSISVCLNKKTGDVTYVFDGEDRGLVESLDDMKRLLSFIAEGIQGLDKKYKGRIRKKIPHPRNKGGRIDIRTIA